jgi:SHS2 domain-containing protein
MYEIVQHTADVRMQVSAASQEELFAEAVRGLMNLVEPEGIQKRQVRAQIHIAAPDLTSLLVDFLNEVLTRCHIRREVYPRVVFPSMTAVALDAELEGHPVAGFAEDVKAVTYHEADVRERDGLWTTTLVFDI